MCLDDLNGRGDGSDGDGDRPRALTSLTTSSREEYRDTHQLRDQTPTHFDLCAAVTLGTVRQPNHRLEQWYTAPELIRSVLRPLLPTLCVDSRMMEND